MREFWILFKVNIINTFGINQLKKKFASNSFFLRIVMPILIGLLAIAILIGLIYYMKPIGDIFYAADNMSGYLKYGIGMGILMCFITTISKAHSYLFEAKDYDLLMSLPIKSRVIITSKFASLLFINFASFALFFIPTVVWYINYVQPGFDFYILSVLTILIGPLLIITICSVIAYFLGILISRFKYRNMLQTVGLIIFFLFVMFISLSVSNFSDVTSETDQIKAIASKFENYATTFYYPSVWMAEALEGNIISLLIFLGISFVPYIIFAYVVGHNFAKANARARVSYTNKHFKLKDQEVTSQTKTLFKKEIKRYFSSSVLVLNTIVGPIMGTILMCILLFSGDNGLAAVGMGEASELIMPILIGAVTFMNGLISTTSTSISLEGKNFWIIKSAPIKIEKIYTAKIALNFVIALPFSIINTVVIAIALKPDVTYLIPFLLIPLLVNLVMGVTGLYINLVFPRLNWTMEVKVVKQSLSMLLSMLFGMVLVFALAYLFYVTYSLGYLAYIIVILCLVAIILIGIILLETDGKKRFNRINA